MTLRRLEMLQWAGLLLGALAFTFAHVVGYGITEAQCNAAGLRWGISNDTWELAALGAAAAFVVVSELAAALVVVRTREESYEDPPPPGRVRLLAIAAVVANVIFLTIIVLDALGAVLNVTCRQG
jgi:amino acid transporter